MDKQVERAKKHHINFIVCAGFSYPIGEKLELNEMIRKTIPWGGRFTGGYPVGDLEAWKEFLFEAAKRYRDFIKYWEIWNEVDLGFYCGTADEYTTLLKAAYCEIKRANPQAKVLYGASCMCPYFAERVMESGGENYLDGLAVHHYNTPPNVEGVNERAVYHLAQHLFKQYGFGGKEIINTEGSIYSYPYKNGTSCIFDDTGRKVSDIIKIYTLMRPLGIKRFCWYAPWGIFTQSKTKQLRPMPAAVGYAVASLMLEDAKYVGQIDCQDPDISAYLYKKGKVPLLIVWNRKWEGKKEVSFNFYSPSVKIINRLNESKTERTENGKLNLTVTHEPLFITGIGEQIFANAKIDERQVEFQKISRDGQKRAVEKWKDYEPNVWVSSDIIGRTRRYGRWPGELLIGDPFRARKYELLATVHNYKNEKVEGTLKVSIPKSWKVSPASQAFAVEPLKTADAKFTLTIPPGFPYFADVSLAIAGELKGGKKLIPYRTKTEVRPKFDVTFTMEEKKGGYNIKVKVGNRDKEPAGGEISIFSPFGEVSPKVVSFKPVKKLEIFKTEFTLKLSKGKKISPLTPFWVLVKEKGEIVGIAGSDIAAGIWRFKFGDDLEYKEADYDDSSWEEWDLAKKAPTIPYSGYDDHPADPWFKGYIWWREKIYVPEEFSGDDLVIHLGSLKDAGKVYFNGQRIGICGGLPPDYWCGWGAPVKYVVPKEIVNFGKQNAIAIRTYTEDGSINICGDIPRIILPLKKEIVH